ncbi:MAG: hypothetical protein SCK28_05195 [Bacillota bacterium]|nr:hypothetical protein [Bacillota bacterium]
MTQKYCVRCGQDLQLADWSPDYSQGVRSSKGDLCGYCAASLTTEESSYWD